MSTQAREARVTVIDAGGRLVAAHSVRLPDKLQLSISPQGPPVLILIEGVSDAVSCKPGAELTILLP